LALIGVHLRNVVVGLPAGIDARAEEVVCAAQLAPVQSGPGVAELRVHEAIALGRLDENEIQVRAGQFVAVYMTVPMTEIHALCPLARVPGRKVELPACDVLYSGYGSLC